MPCPLPSTSRSIFGSATPLSPCLIDNACALNVHSQAAQTALQHPIANFKDGFGYVGPQGQFVDRDSFLRNGTVLTQNGSKTLLPNPGFLTVPYMGYGRNNACTSNVVLESKDTGVKKSCIPPYARSNFMPLLGCISESIQHPQHIISEDVKKDWVRGGYPSRNCVYSCRMNKSKK